MHTDATREGFFRNIFTNTHFFPIRVLNYSGSVWLSAKWHFRRFARGTCKREQSARATCRIHLYLPWNPILSLSFSFGFPFLPLSIPLSLFICFWSFLFPHLSSICMTDMLLVRDLCADCRLEYYIIL